MKRTAAVLIALFVLSFAARAVPAYPRPVKVTQPDGSEITIQLHGDENSHWLSSNGVEVARGKDGFYRPVTAGGPVARRAKAAAAPREKRAPRAKVPVFGTHHFLVLLVEFADVAFTVDNPKESFSNLLNQKNYSGNGATGSANDYFLANSKNMFNPKFDIVGPITLSKSQAYYGANEDGEDDPRKLWEFVKEACGIAKTQFNVDFSEYDLDNNGEVDGIFLYYAGENEAEHGGEDTIWPHAWGVWGYYVDGKQVTSYACSSEYNYNHTMCGIGTFCHEFGHVLGLPDFYDTDYEDNGFFNPLDDFSLMDNGSYNNEGRTPPYLTAIERELLNWMDLKELKEDGNYTLKGIQENVAYKINTPNKGEFFVLETRTGGAWDAFVSKGLLIYHVDKSKNVVGERTAAELWRDGDGINCYGNHPCCYIVKSGSAATAPSPFPGPLRKTEFTQNTFPSAKAWSGLSAGFIITNIGYSSQGQSTLTFTKENEKRITGKVTDTSGNPIVGATVNITSSSKVKQAVAGQRSKAPSLFTAISGNEIRKAAVRSATTDSEGYYNIDLMDDISNTKYVLVASRQGYISRTQEVSLQVGVLEQNFTLRRVNEPLKETLHKYKSGGMMYGWFTDGEGGHLDQNVMLGIQFSVQDLKEYVGSRITGIAFYAAAGDGSDICALVDIGGKRVYCEKVDNYKYLSLVKVDLSDADLIIPEGRDVIVGYGIKDNTGNADYVCDEGPHVPGGMMVAPYGSTNWFEYTAAFNCNYNLVIAMQVEGVMEDTLFYTLGYNTIEFSSTPVAGEEISLFIIESSRVPASVEWYVDSQKLPTEKTAFTKGKHLVEARLKYEDGQTEIIRRTVTVN